ncbi:small ligand-binding sensory domain FIST [Methylobacterium sp. OAE515]|uniref:head-tail joining protein n=1 Tax=Methylobacterium sp. OAE515 TaxID=2817895 RepID=UPI0017891C6D
MIDFAALALGPGIATFGRPVTVTPPASKPPRPAFDATGVWTTRNVNVEMGPGQQSLNTVTITLGIRLSEWPVAPAQGMAIRVPAAGSYPDEGTLWIDDVDQDGQGGATLTLKRKSKGA